MVALVSELTMERKADHGLLRKFLVLGAVLVFGAATCTAIYYGILYHQLHERVQHQSKIPVSETNGTNFVKSQVTHNMASDKVRIITKDKWLAQPPTQPANPLKHPVPCVVILHTATKNCSTQAQCTLFVRQIQTYHIKSCGYLDIGHSFLVGGDGNVYEGRGWDGAGAFTYGYNNVSIGIGFIGTFISALPSEKQIAAGKALIAEGVRLGKIITDNTHIGKLRIVKRMEWLAQPPIRPATPLKHPVPYVVILHTATENCSTLAQCVFFVRRTQTFHIESNGWWDIGYSFLVGGDGNVYEGRGWDGVGAFAYGYNNVSIGISFIGTFTYELPPPKQIAAGKALITEGVRLGKISKEYKLLAHRQISPTNGPGLAFFENIKTWDHWAEKPSET